MTDIGKMKVTKKPKNAEAIPILEFFNRKEDSLTRENIFKCRFVARSDLEKNEGDKNLHSPVCSLELTGIFIALCAHFKGTLRQADSTSGFCRVN